MTSMRDTAVAVGFDPDRAYRGYNVEVMTRFILEDRAVAAALDVNWRRELKECPQEHSHPDDILIATLQSMTDLEKAALRRRVYAQFEAWDTRNT